MKKRVVVRVNVVVVNIVMDHVVVRRIDGGILIFPFAVILFNLLPFLNYCFQ